MKRHTLERHSLKRQGLKRRGFGIQRHSLKRLVLARKSLQKQSLKRHRFKEHGLKRCLHQDGIGFFCPLNRVWSKSIGFSLLHFELMAGSLSSLKAAAEAVLISRKDIVAGKPLAAKARVGQDLESALSKSSFAEHKEGSQDGEKHVSVSADSADLRTPEKPMRKRPIPTPSAPRKASQEAQEQASKLSCRTSLKRPAAFKGC